MGRTDWWSVGAGLFGFAACFLLGFLLGAHLMWGEGYGNTSIQERVDEQQMRLDILIDELKRVDAGRQIDWDRL